MALCGLILSPNTTDEDARRMTVALREGLADPARGEAFLRLILEQTSGGVGSE